NQSPEQSQNQALAPTQLHHVPHPHTHHSHAHARRTHVHGQPHPSESGSLYSPFDVPVAMDLTLLGLSPDVGLGGMDGMGGMNGMLGSGEGGGNGDGIGGIPPGEVRVNAGLTSSAQADLQRRTEEIFAFSARNSMGGAGAGEGGR
ncbi:hypothetical protein EW145_g8608, partial [Phellinidium pouzarii]